MLNHKNSYENKEPCQKLRVSRPAKHKIKPLLKTLKRLTAENIFFVFLFHVIFKQISET